jgi:hypothetical protein
MSLRLTTFCRSCERGVRHTALALSIRYRGPCARESLGNLRSRDAQMELRKKQLKLSAKDRAEAEAWSIRMEGYGGPAQPSPTIGQCLNGGYSWMEIECNRCKTRTSIPLDAIRRPRDTPIRKLEGSFRCRSCGTRRYKPPVHMIKLTEVREITPYVWVHPGEER